MKSENYTVTSDGAGGWTVTGEDGRTVPATLVGDNLTFDGIEIDVSGGGFDDGDSFTLNPIAGAAEGMARSLGSAQEFGSSGG
ncbi:flagellar hook-associated protein 1 [Enterobacter cloacae]|uniref:Flagellar hook-associated protein 1 n=1 Tax=Enterobacter cloacae TaxID=550 RepID=A0A377LZF9_ENTCL|nr:flagellar hook-associated protein 1 [Enterobacter cloacae]